MWLETLLMVSPSATHTLNDTIGTIRCDKLADLAVADTCVVLRYWHSLTDLFAAQFRVKALIFAIV